MIVKTDVSFAALTFIYSPAQYNLISVKAFIHQPGMYDIEIKKGHTFRYDIWFGGEPPPIVTWEREGSLIQPEQASISGTLPRNFVDTFNTHTDLNTQIPKLLLSLRLMIVTTTN